MNLRINPQPSPFRASQNSALSRSAVAHRSTHCFASAVEATLCSAIAQWGNSLPEQYFTLFCRCGTWLLRALLCPCDRCLSVHYQSAASLCYAVPSLCQSEQHPCTQVCTLPTLCHSLPTFADALPCDRSRAVAPPCIALPCRCAVCYDPELPCRCYAILVSKSCAVTELFITIPALPAPRTVPSRSAVADV